MYIRLCHLWAETFLCISFWFGCILFHYLELLFSSGLPELLNRNDKYGHLCLAWDLWGKSFQFFTVEYDVIVGFLCMTFIIWGNFLVYLICWVFLLWKGECFFCIYWDDHMTFILHSINVISHLMIFIYWIILASQT